MAFEGNASSAIRPWMGRGFASLGVVALLFAARAAVATAQEQPPSSQGSLAAAGNPLLGGVPDGEPTAGTLSLRLVDAVQRGLAHNLGAVLAAESLRAAEAGRDLARGSLLPTLDGSAYVARQEINLEAYGFPVAPGTSPVVGPFNVGDVRVRLSQPILDLAALDRARAGGQGLEAAKQGYRDVREMVVMTCASLYLEAALGASRIEAARTQEAVAAALLDRAQRLKDSGVVAGIEVLRARVQREAQRQRVIFYENEFAKQKLALARAVGLPLRQEFDLADELADSAGPVPSVEAAVEEALRSRPDLMQAESAYRAAEETRRAGHDEGLPSIRFDADLGWIGPTTDRLERTFSVGASVRIPLFEGGRIRANSRLDEAALQQVRARRDDLRAKIEYDVRTALLDVEAAGERAKVAREALDLADEQLRQSQDRFASGVAGNLEVVQAQDAVATASENHLSALYAHNLARLALSRAAGGAERSLPTLLGGGGGDKQ
jgi:outer membrane protein TolC